MNTLAEELNSIIGNANPYVFEMLSEMGKQLFFPKGILSQSAEAKQKADKINATIGIAKQDGKVMNIPSTAACIQGMDPDNYLSYAPSFGVLDLRKKWKTLLYQKNSNLENKKVSLPVVTSGITHGISTFADLWVNPGDKIILPDMIWGNYRMTFCVRNRAEIVNYDIFNSSLSGFNIDSFEKTVRKEAKLAKKIIVVLNFPHNPSGYAPTVEEGQKIASILVDIAKNGTNVVAACDDAYFGLFFEDDTMKESIFSLLAGADERLVAVKLDGATKEDFAWGLRVGFITYGLAARNGVEDLYDALEKKTAGCIRGNISNASHLSQSIVLHSMEDKGYSKNKKDKFDLLMERAHTIKDVLKSVEYKNAWDVYPFNSGYFMCLRIKEVNAEILRIHLLENYGTGLISVGDTDLRVAFSCLEKNDIKTLFDTILKGINDLKKK